MEKFEKVFPYLFFGVLGIVIFLTTIYFVLHSESLGNWIKSIGKGQNITVNSIPSSIPNPTRVQNKIFTQELPHALVGKEYQGLIVTVVYGKNIAMSGRVLTALPEGLEFSPCKTEFNNAVVAAIEPVNSIGKCYITGVPQKVGTYNLKIEITIPGENSLSQDLTLTIDP